MDYIRVELVNVKRNWKQGETGCFFPDSCESWGISFLFFIIWWFLMRYHVRGGGEASADSNNLTKPVGLNFQLSWIWDGLAFLFFNLVCFSLYNYLKLQTHFILNFLISFDTVYVWCHVCYGSAVHCYFWLVNFIFVIRSSQVRLLYIGKLQGVGGRKDQSRRRDRGQGGFGRGRERILWWILIISNIICLFCNTQIIRSYLKLACAFIFVT